MVELCGKILTFFYIINLEIFNRQNPISQWQARPKEIDLIKRICCSVKVHIANGTFASDAHASDFY